MKFKELNEKATSVAQQRLMALALQHKRGELPADKVSPAVKDLAKGMSEKDLEDFAKTKHKGLPQKKEDNEVSNRSAALKPQMYNDPVTGKKKVRMVPTKTNIVKTNDSIKEAKDPNEYDNEGEMAKTQLRTIMRNAEEMMDLLDDEENLPEWVQNKITKASDYMTSAYNYMASEDDDDDKEDVKEYVEMGTDDSRRAYSRMTPGQNEAMAAGDRIGALAAVGAAAYGAKKVKDRLDPVKVADARRKRDERRAEVDKARRELDQRKKYRQKLRDMQQKQRAGK
jgi:hypothetical protein